MSLQVFLYAQFRGIERFLADAPPDGGMFSDRTLWISLLSEVLPKAFLAERGLSPLLAGYTGGGVFLLLLPEPAVPEAEAFLAELRGQIETATAESVELHWSRTENLGPWPHILKRLEDGMRRSRNAPLAHRGAAAFTTVPLSNENLWQGLASRLQGAATVGWSPEAPLSFLAGEGKHQFEFGKAPEGVTCPIPPTAPQTLSSGARGRRRWGILRCDVDQTLARLKSASSADEFLYLALLYKGVVAGELQRIAAMPNHEGRVAVVYSGGDDFAVAGSWDALLSVAAEFHRVFGLFTADLPGGRTMSDGATLSAALTVAAPNEPLHAVWVRNREALDTVKSSGRNALALFGRILEWNDLRDAEGLKTRMRRLRESFGCPPELFSELEDFYGERGAGEGLASPRSRRRERRLDRPWRFHSRLRRVAGDRSGPEFERQWRAFLGDLLGRGGQKQLRPAGKVALEWALLEAGSQR